jgi:hypothetical protein
MPDITIHNQTLLSALVGLMNNAGFPASVHLYVNNVSPDPTSNDPAQFTEASYPGYASQNYPYTPFALLGPDKAQLAPAVISFNPPSSGGPFNVYGFYVLSQVPFGAANKVMMSARFDPAPRVLHVGDPVMTFNIFFTDQDESR